VRIIRLAEDASAGYGSIPNLLRVPYQYQHPSLRSIQKAYQDVVKTINLCFVYWDRYTKRKKHRYAKLESDLAYARREVHYRGQF
jgi:hypothetical protein